MTMTRTGPLSVESRNRVEMRVDPRALNPDARMDVVRLIRAGLRRCGCGPDVSPAGTAGKWLHVDPGVLLDLPKAMHAAQTVHQHAGGVHAAALFDQSGRTDHSL